MEASPLRELRTARGLSMKEAADRALVSEGYWRSVESGGRMLPRGATLDRFAAALKVRAADLRALDVVHRGTAVAVLLEEADEAALKGAAESGAARTARLLVAELRGVASWSSPALAVRAAAAKAAERILAVLDGEEVAAVAMKSVFDGLSDGGERGEFARDGFGRRLPSRREYPRDAAGRRVGL